MTARHPLLAGPLRVVTAGPELFASALRAQGAAVQAVDWRPPAGGDPDLTAALDALDRPEVAAANAEAVRRLLAAEPALVGMGTAGEVIPGMTRTTVLHAGPPVTWDRMCGPMRGAVLGALVYEGLAATLAEAEQLAGSGGINFQPCHELNAVGPMAGIVTASMPVFIIENRAFGNQSYCTINEGLGKVLRYGANSPEVLDRLRWIEKVLAPVLGEAIRLSGGLDLRTLIAQVLHMGDEGHNRNKAGTSLFLRAILPHLLAVGGGRGIVRDCVQFINGNDHFFLNLTMPACKAALEAAHGIPHSTLVTTMARNGVEFGIRVSGAPGRWFTGPAQMIRGLYFPGFADADANPDIGDSAITETGGIGGFAMAAAPAIVQFVGGSPADALGYTTAMYEITLAEHATYTVPALGFRGTPIGIDVRKVVDLDLLPIINTGIAHRRPGVGQVGAGLVRPPREAFTSALLALAGR